LEIIVGKSGHLILDEVHHFFAESCSPPLPTTVMERNSGRLVVRSEDLIRWVEAQRGRREKVGERGQS